MKKSASEKKSLLRQYDQVFLDQGFRSLAGVDEAGRGPLAGPVVASAVIVRDFSFSARIDDSKKMSAKDRIAAYDQILEKGLVGIGVVEPEGIDTLNIFQATMKAMQDAVGKLKEIPDCLLIDGPYTPELPHKRFAIVNGDALSFSIACASIVAKVTRDRMMEYYDEIYPEYGFKKHKGYGTKEHFEALRKNGPCRIHRRSFEPVKSLCDSSLRT
ncbi:MAG: ribonuclease HII [Candidatus Omnitrophica bacterium CG1_02_46_14]|nr:MAG: ribonuclease HII [Candidatus Omnitrophica bacterium CG1_02_46_14]